MTWRCPHRGLPWRATRSRGGAPRTRPRVRTKFRATRQGITPENDCAAVSAIRTFVGLIPRARGGRGYGIRRRHRATHGTACSAGRARRRRVPPARSCQLDGPPDWLLVGRPTLICVRRLAGVISTVIMSFEAPRSRHPRAGRWSARTSKAVKVYSGASPPASVRDAGGNRPVVLRASARCVLARIASRDLGVDGVHRHRAARVAVADLGVDIARSPDDHVGVIVGDDLVFALDP